MSLAHKTGAPPSSASTTPAKPAFKPESSPSSATPTSSSATSSPPTSSPQSPPSWHRAPAAPSSPRSHQLRLHRRPLKPPVPHRHQRHQNGHPRRRLYGGPRWHPIRLPPDAQARPAPNCRPRRRLVFRQHVTPSIGIAVSQPGSLARGLDTNPWEPKEPYIDSSAASKPPLAKPKSTTTKSTWPRRLKPPKRFY